MASMFTAGTTMFGCSGYHDLQNYGCDCLPPDQAKLRMLVYVNELWSTYNRTHPEMPQKVVDRFLNHPETRSRDKQISAHGTLLYKLFEKYTDVIDKISNDGQASRDHPSFFTPRVLG